VSRKTTLGVIVGNRGFFPDHLAESGRKEVLKVLAEAGLDAVCLTPEDTPFGTVESNADVEKCAKLFRAHEDVIDGIVVTLPNFGDERGVANTLRAAKLDVPVLIQAHPDDPSRMGLADRRDSFCGKMSVCNNLVQYGIPFSLTKSHTVHPETKEFRADLDWFASGCRVVRGLKGATVGAIGARPAAFKTVRFSEKLLEASGISVEVVDLSEILGQVGVLKDDDPAVKERIAAIKDYMDVGAAPEAALLKLAKLGVVVDRWREENRVVATAFQCWSAIQTYLGVCSCSTMSMMSEDLAPSACEVDVMGAVAMYSMALASGSPSGLLDWNNNFGDDPDKCMLFHCSNIPKSLLRDPKLGIQDILAATVGADNTWGTCCGTLRPGPVTFARLSTNDNEGEGVGYIAPGEITHDEVESFGGYGVARVPDLQTLLKFICRMGFEHHVALNPTPCARAVYEAWTTYMGWSIYLHEA